MVEFTESETKREVDEYIQGLLDAAKSDLTSDPNNTRLTDSTKSGLRGSLSSHGGIWDMFSRRDKVATMRLRLSAIDYLTAVKQRHRYTELEKYTGLKPSVLTRYVKGRVIPTEKRAKELITTLSEHFGLTDLFKEYVTLTQRGWLMTQSLSLTPRCSGWPPPRRLSGSAT